MDMEYAWLKSWLSCYTKYMGYINILLESCFDGGLLKKHYSEINFSKYAKYNIIIFSANLSKLLY